MNTIIPLTSDLEANCKRFIEHIQESGQVWSLKSDDGWVVVDSAEFEDSEVMPFWSDESYAQQHCVDQWANFKPTSISLEDFIDEWLTGMAEEGVLVGPNWNADLEGLELEPDEVLEQLSEQPHD
jgi:hypothetical protein